MKKVFASILVIMIFALLWGCQPMPSVEELIEEEVDKKQQKLKLSEQKSCRQSIFLDAEQLVDSIMYLEIGTSFNQDLPIPEKPSRPDDSSEYVFELDTGKVTPLLPDSLSIDSISLSSN